MPSGVWEREEYLKLVLYDAPTASQPARTFACHQADGRLCAGWVGCHDMEENLALRIAAVSGDLSAEVIEEVRDYVCDVELFDSGFDAAVHGLRDLHSPSPAANKLRAKLTQKLSRKVDTPS